jgi:glycosyltransferase involved in cell wall biosynthesis
MSVTDPIAAKGLRVLLICDWFLKYVADLAIALAGDRHDVRLLCRAHDMEFGGDPDEREKLLERVRQAGVAVHEVPGRPWSVRAAPAAFRAIAAARKGRPDVVHVQEAVYDPRLLLASGRQPVVLTIHDPEPHLGAYLNSKHRVAQRLWRRRAHTFIVHSTHLVPLLNGGRRRTDVVPHGADLHPQPDPVPPTPRVLMFGRLEPYKGLGVLLDAMQRVWERRPDVRLTVAGAGSESVRIPDDERIDARIGYLPEASVDELFAGASVVVLPYLDASQSGVGLLALARGVPVVVTDVGGLPELALDSSYIVAPGDVTSLADAIVAHLGDDDDTRRRVLETAASRFSWPVVARRTAAVYEQVLQATGRGAR